MVSFRILVLMLLGSAALRAQTFEDGIVSQRLLSNVANEPGAFHHVYILLRDQVDVLGMDAEFFARKASLETRSVELIAALQEKAETGQRALLDVLHTAPAVRKESIHPFWITSVIFAEMKGSLIAELSRHPDVAFIDLNPELLRTSVEATAGIMLQPNGREPGLGAINAPAMWAKGYTGYGRVGYCNDTGIDPTHPALMTKYRGWYAPPAHGWYQPGSNNTTPFDCEEHGTHVTGTMMGLDRLTNDTIGVAFNAQWIGSASLCGFGAFGLTGSLQWALNPDGNPSTIDDRPDVINNSWYDPSTQNECTGLYVSVLNSLQTAGVAVVFSAGNEGPGVSTITPPHNINTGLVNSFTVGAVNGNVSSLPIASFSSRGPSQCGGTGSLLIKPEVSAPGVQVRSSVPGGAYDNLNGTSMAAPHVSGAILLLKEAFPFLTGQEIMLALYYSCTDLGEPGEDNTFGQGIINVDAAYEYLTADGHVPVSPAVELDLLVLDVQVKELFCANGVSFEVLVENGGTDTILNFEVSYQLPGNSGNHTWEGMLIPGERVLVNIEGITQTMGSHTLLVEVPTINGQSDERPLNNRFQRSIEVSSRPFAEASATLGSSGTLCSGSQALLRSGQGEGASVNWYLEETGGEPVGGGEAWLTDTLYETSTYYAELNYHRQVGRTDDEGGDPKLSAQGSTNAEGLIFDAYQPFLLESVTVYAEVPGLRIIKLRHSDGSSIIQRFVNVPAGESRIELNMNVPAENNLQLVLDGGNPLYYTSTAAGFPYEVPDIVRLFRSKIGVSTTSVTRYYFFFDWAISFVEPCGRTPVEVTVENGAPLPQAAFSASATELTLTPDGTAVVNLLNESTGAETWFWDFGDGQTSTAESPLHVYTAAGHYWVSLTVEHASSCPASATMLIQVVESPLSALFGPVGDDNLSWSVYPNPAQDRVWLRIETVEAARVSLVDVQGRLLRDYGLQNTSGADIELLLPSVASGNYFLVVEQNGLRAAQPLQINRP